MGLQDGTFVVIALHAGGRPLAILLALGGLASATGLLFTRLCMNSRLVQSMFHIHQVCTPLTNLTSPGIIAYSWPTKSSVKDRLTARTTSHTWHSLLLQALNYIDRFHSEHAYSEGSQPFPAGPRALSEDFQRDPSSGLGAPRTLHSLPVALPIHLPC